MRLVAGLVLILLVPTATAQVPDPSDAEDTALQLLCSIERDLPLCPVAPVAAPDPAAPAPKQGSAVARPQPVAELEDAVEDIADDPATAPDRLGDVVASLLAFVEDLLDLPSVAAASVRTAASEALAGATSAAASAGEQVASGASAAAGGVADTAARIVDALASLVAASSEVSPEPAPEGRKNLVETDGARCLAGVCVEANVALPTAR